MRICIFGASGRELDARYYAEAEAVGRLIGENGDSIVFGGGAEGLMGACARGVSAAGGDVVGIADVTEQFEKGALATLSLAQSFSVKAAVLKSNSPSCGSGTIYDGSFTGTLVPGDGVTAELLKKHGVRVTDENALL